MSRGNRRNRGRQKSKVEIIKEGIMEYGLLFFVFKSLKKGFKSIWRVLIFRGKEKLKSPMKKIYERWEEDWLADEPDKNKAREEPFFLLFKFDYEYCCQKALENKKKNFCVKFYCILPFLIVTFLYLGGVLAYNVNVLIQVKGDLTKFIESNNWNFSIYGTVFYAVAILLTYVVSKWIDVKQYQETWNRHSEHKYAVEIEMFKYISYMDDYCLQDRKKKFVENIMQTWDDNQKKFTENMKKEKNIGMKDLLEYIKGEKND